MRRLTRTGGALPVWWLLLAGLLILPVLVYGRFLLGDELANADVFLAYRPAHAWLAEGLRSGRVPLWNPYLLGGFPLAFSEYGWFSPLNWAPLILFGPHTGFYLAVALYVALSGLATFALARLWGAGALAAVLAAGVYSQSLLVIGGAPLLNQGAAYWALPAALWCVQRHLDGHRLGAPLLAALVALTLLGSHPQQALIAGAPAALYALYAAARCRGARTPGVLLPLAGAALVGGTVAAVRLVPSLSLLGASARAGGLEFSASALGSVNPLALASGLLLPSLDLPFGLLRPQWTAYLGPLPLLLCLFGLGRVRAERSGPFVAALGLAGLLLALGSYTPLYWVISRTPLLSYFREPSRFLLWTVLAVAVVAAWGLEEAPRRAPTLRGAAGALWWLAAVLLVLGVLGFGAVNTALRQNERVLLNNLRLRALSQPRTVDYPVSFYVEGADAGWRQAVRVTDLRSPGLLVPLAALLGTLWWWRWGRRTPWGQGAGLALAVAPLVLYGQVRLPGIPAAVVAETPQSVGLAREAGGDAPPADPALLPRAYAWLPLATDFEARRTAEATGQNADVVSYRLLRNFLAPNLGTSYAVPVVDGYENLMTREQTLLVAALGSERAGTAGDDSQTGLTRLGLLERRQRVGERWGLLAAAGGGTLFSGDRLRPETWPSSVRYERSAVAGGAGVPPLNVYQLVRPLPRAFVVDEWATAASPTQALGRLIGAPPGESGAPPVVVVPPPGASAPRSPRAPGSERDAARIFDARIVRYEERLVEVETEADGDALLVLLDANAPGWTATVTGAPAPVLTANVAFRAVPIPAGKHLVRFSYTPPVWRPALLSSAAGLAVLGLWAALTLRRGGGRAGGS